MSLAFYNPYNTDINPLKIYNRLCHINNGLGLNIKYDPESNRVSFWASMPTIEDYIEIILPYDFDPSFFISQIVEIKCVINRKYKKEYVNVCNYNEIITNTKKLIVRTLIENNIYQFDNLQAGQESSLLKRDFTFFKWNANFQGIIYFMDGNVNMLILPIHI